MVDINRYLFELCQLLKSNFGERLVYVGLQGSYLRGEATDHSDIDIMAVIDGLSVADLKQYRAIIDSLPYSDRARGFICSKADLAAWNPLEICNLLHSTRDYYGVLSDIIPTYCVDDVRNFVKLSLNNLYHEICHRYIHGSTEKNVEALPYTSKGVFFILQNLHYLRSNHFLGTKGELLKALTGKDQAVLLRAMELNQGISHDFENNFELLFTWCQETLQSL